MSKRILAMLVAAMLIGGCQAVPLKAPCAFGVVGACERKPID